MKDKINALFIDHDSEVLNRLVNAIGDSKLAGTNFRDQLDISSMIIPPGEIDLEDFPNQITSKIRQEAYIYPDIILIDLNYNEKSPPIRLNGFELCRLLQPRFFEIPVGVFSRASIKAEEMKEYPEIPTYGDVFGGTITELEEGKTRQGLTHIKSTLTAAITSHKQQLDKIPGIYDFDTKFVEWSGVEPRSKLTKRCCEIISILVTRRYLPEKLSLSLIGGGFSGSVVIQAVLDDRKYSLVIKADENPETIHKELKANENIYLRTHADFYVDAARGQYGEISPRFWAGMSMPHEQYVHPLISLANIEVDDLATLYSRVWNDCLNDLYEVGSEIEETVSTSILKDSIHLFNRNKQQFSAYHEVICCEVLNEENGVLFSEIEMMFGHLESDGTLSQAAQQKRKIIHGDLNCRNILATDDLSTFKLIDFPLAGPGFLADDFVRAECEYMLFIHDHHKGKDIITSNIHNWLLLVDTSTESFKQFGNVNSAAIKSIREAYLDNAGLDFNSVTAYYLRLIFRLCSLIAFDDIRFAKKIFALAWIRDSLAKLKTFCDECNK